MTFQLDSLKDSTVPGYKVAKFKSKADMILKATCSIICKLSYIISQYPPPPPPNRHSLSSVAEFMDPVRELKPALKWG
jgi:hypothetical protein